MCGITGIFSHHGPKVAGSSISRMNHALRHRGPDGEGVWLDPKGRIGLGHRRLAVLDLSAAGQQPMQYATGRYTITFNGEIYNYLELRAELCQRGYQFRSQTDTEVLLALYDLKKEKCLQDLDGMFAFALWDKEEAKLFCARDRFGEKPFFYHANRRQFIFASEMKALFDHGVDRTVSEKRLHYYLSFGLEEDPSDPNSTFFSEIKKLAPAHFMEVSLSGEIRMERYWEIDLQERSKLSLPEATDHFQVLFLESLNRRLRSDVAVGSSLSGGLDSSAIVYAAHRSTKRLSNGFKTFSARFENFDKDEGEFIEDVTKALPGIDSHVTWPNEEGLQEDLEEMLYYQEEPFGSASVFAQWEVMKLARQQGVTVLLDGQGADEVLAGYMSYYGTYLNQLYRSDDPSYAEEALKYAEFRGHVFQPDKVVAKESCLVGVVGDRACASAVADNPSWPEYHADFAQVATMYADPRRAMAEVSSLRQRQMMALQTGSLPTILRFADRNSMAFSREIRLPFLSHHLVEFAFSLPDHFKLFQGWTKYIFRKGLQGCLSDKIVWRKDKIGYAVPQEKWLRSEKFKQMVRQARETLISARILSAEAKSSMDWQALLVAHLFC